MRRGIETESAVSRTSAGPRWEDVEHHLKRVKDVGRGCSSAKDCTDDGFSFLSRN